MKKTVILLIGLLTYTLTIGQPNDISNSFEKTYKKTNPGIQYSYDENEQIHNYSNNWDFDNDGINDELYFVGTGGAHLYYFLKVILSSDKVVRDFPYLDSDFPILPSGKELTQSGFNPENVYFAVFDINKNNRNAIFIRLDNSSFWANKKILKSQGIQTNAIVVTFENGKTVLKDFGKGK